MERVKHADVVRYVNNAQRSNMARSSRRLFFTYQESLEEQWHADQLYGVGSSILLRYRKTFFLLTAKHVIRSNIYEGKYQNDAPFFTSKNAYSVKGDSNAFESVYDLLWPARMWDIGTLIKQRSSSLDLSDVCLIELFMPFGCPDHFIDLDNKDGRRILKQRDFFPGQFLIVSGYPHKTNDYSYEPKGEFSHSTNLNRVIATGVYDEDKYGPYVSLSHPSGAYRHKDLNGFSGGLICNVQPKANQIDWCGMALTGGGGIVRFIPSDILIEAICAYQNAPVNIIDPAVDKALRPEEVLEICMTYLEERNIFIQPKAE